MPVLGDEKYLIVGASRGIGYGLATELQARGKTVLATSRNGSGDERLTWLRLDLTDDGSRLRFSKLPELAGVTHVIIAAGVMPKDVDDTLAPADVVQMFMTNSVAPIVLANLLSKNTVPPRIFMFLSSIMGSVALNKTGDHWIYRASKAALNSAAHSFQKRNSNSGGRVLVVHPGWVRTDMGGKDADIDVQTSVDGIVELLINAESMPPFHFCDYLGKKLPY